MKYIGESIRESFLENFKRNHRFEGLDCPSYEGAYVLPYIRRFNNYSGVVTSEGFFVEHSAVHEGLENGRVGMDPEVEEMDCEAIFLGSMMSVYGHCITDNLKKIWYLNTPEAKSLIDAGAVVVYVSAWDDYDLPDYAMRILELAGVDITCLKRISVPMRFKRVHVPCNSMRLLDGTRQWSPEFRVVVEKMKSNANFKGDFYDRIYFTRTALNDRKDFGEKRVEKLFESAGYKVLSPEKFSVDAQILLMSNCSHVVCTDGSVAHNALFCNSETKVTILLKADYVNGYQMMINDMVGYDLEYVDANHTIRHRKRPWAGPFYMSPTSHLRAYLNMRKCPDLYWFRLDWYKYLYYRFLR